MNLSRSNTRPLTDDEPQIISATVGAKSVNWYDNGSATDMDNCWQDRKAGMCFEDWERPEPNVDDYHVR